MCKEVSQMQVIDIDELEAGGTSSYDKGMLVAFEEIRYTVPDRRNKSQQNTLINDCSGYFAPGRMTALIGPSGSGKTTLLDVLSGRKSSGAISGQITFNGKPSSPDVLKTKIGYVEQSDTLLPELTVREMLSYAATFKLVHLTRKDISDKVDEVLKSLQLEDCQHTIIGDKMHRGVSGGQAKRVNIGLALLTSPSVIFLDEPTSGLDSKTADAVITCIRKLADMGHTIVATIHSPSSYAFGLFDSLVLLKAGELIYQGPLAGDATHTKQYFHEQGFSLPTSVDRVSGAITPYSISSVEWIVDTIGATHDFSAAYKQSALYGENAKQRQQLVSWAKEATDTEIGSNSNSSNSSIGSSSVQDPAAPISNSSADSAGGAGGAAGAVVAASRKRQCCSGLCNLPHATWTLLRFRGARHLCSFSFLAPRMGGPIFYALVLWSLFAGIGERASTDPAAAQSVSGLMFATVVLCGYEAAPFVPSISLDRPIFYRDRADGYYGSAAYVLAKLAEDAVVMAVTAVIYSVIVFYGCALSGSFAVFLGVRFFASMVGVALAYWSAAVSPTMASACAILPAIVTVGQFLSGYIITYGAMPAGWYWFYHINFLQYGLTALLNNQFEDAAGQGNLLATQQLQTYNLAGDQLTQQPSFGIAMLAVVMAAVLVLTTVTLSVVNHGSR